MKTDELDFHLPPDLIAQLPTPDRAASKLLHYRRADQTLTHRTFSDLPSLLRAGDLLVFNNARVTPARFLLQKPTGGLLEGLYLGTQGTETSPTPELLPRTPGTIWRVLLKNLGPTPPGTVLNFANDARRATVLLARVGEGECRLWVQGTEDPEALLAKLGRMPLPPYIKRARGTDPLDDLDRDRYQTVYASAPGSVAAPTAGLHFTPQILQDLQARGVEQAFVTLNVGIGTFKPVTADTLDEHAMHSESYELTPETAGRINAAHREGRRVIAVGTTSARVLEAQPPGELLPLSAETSIFIKPGYVWKHTSALITNFHLPRSTLIALVSALIGLDAQRRIYAEAIAHRYRFFSYGDSSFLE